MNTSKKGELIAIIKDNKELDGTKIYISGDKDDKELKTVEKIQIDKGKFQLVPDKKVERHSLCVVGRNGSGKSYFIRDYIKEFIKVYGEDYDIYLFSSKETDKELDSIKQIKRLKVDMTFVDNPIDYKALSNTMVIFDDIDALTPKPLKEAIYHLRDKILQNGRSYKIHIISSNHSETERNINVPLKESNSITFFLRNYNKGTRYLIDSYAGLLDSKQIKILRNNNTRATTILKTYPNVILQERNVYTLRGLEN